MRVFLLMAAAVILSSCANMSNFQTARALPKGYGRFMTGVSYFIAPAGTSPGRDIKYAMFETNYRLGLWNRFEIGGKLTLPGTMNGDWKYEIFSDDKIAVAAGMGAGYLAFPAGTASPANQFTRAMLEFWVPVYASYDFSPTLSASIVPRLHLRQEINGNPAIQKLIGSAMGVKLGKRVGFFIEFSYMRGLSSTRDQAQIGACLFFGK